MAKIEEWMSEAKSTIRKRSRKVDCAPLIHLTHTLKSTQVGRSTTLMAC